VTKRAVEQIRRAFGNMRGAVEVRTLTDPERAKLALTEAARGYDLAVVCDVRRRLGNHMLFGETADEFLRHAPCATMLVQSPQPTCAGPVPFEPWTPKVILAPTLGTEHCRHAVEVAAVLAASTNATLIVLHVTRSAEGGRAEMAREVVDHHAAWAERFGARTEALVVDGTEPDQGILAIAVARNVDVIVLGSGLRVSSTRAFFGHRIERILGEASCPVAIVSAH
jgi:nucleotide-binding universal stress UspA family protein